MKVPIRGIVHVTGEPDCGKTTFALQCGAKISRIAFFDADVKGSAVVENLKKQKTSFGMYRDLVVECKGMKELAAHEHCLKLIDAIKPGPLDAIIWDNYSTFEKTFHPYVVKHSAKFRDHYSKKGDIKGAEFWLASFDYEAQVLAHLTTLADLVILVTHLKNHNINGKRTGKLVPDIKRPMVRKPIMRVWLRHNPDSAVPIGLVLKRIGKDVVLEDGSYGKVNILPRRIVPKQEDTSLWDAIARYWETPMGNRKPEKHERPSAFELSILDGTLTSEQKLIFRTGKVEEDEVLDFGDSALEEQVKALRRAGKSIPKISREIGLPKSRVVALLGEG